MQRTVLSCLAAAALFAAVAQAPNPQSRGDPRAGHEIAERWCSNCHLVDRGQRSATDVTPSFYTIAGKPTTSADTLAAFLHMPHEASRMPEFHLSETDIKNLVAYILSLRG